MGAGTWSKSSYTTYSRSLGRSVDSSGIASTATDSVQEFYTERSLNSLLNPYKVVRECLDSKEHPNTVPIILALDVTGSMGEAAVEVAKKLNVIMTNLYSKVTDVEFLVMGIGDLAYDNSPIQASQFESDIRIAEQMDKVYFEFGGGGNSYESYTAAWYFGARCTKLDCTARGKKGIIITIGDELPNPYLPKDALNRTLGVSEQSDVESKALLNEVTLKYDVYHIDVDHGSRFSCNEEIATRWKEVLGQRFTQTTLNDISDVITNLIVESATKNSNGTIVSSEGEISW